MVLYVNGDTQDVHTESEVREAYDEDMAQLAASGCAADPPTFEQWIDDQCDLGLLVVDIDDA